MYSVLQQQEANRRASESEAQHVQRLVANQQRDASRRASESDAEREHRLSSNQLLHIGQMLLLNKGSKEG